MQSGYIDICMQSHCAGWGVENGQPAKLEIFINNVKIGDISCDVDRPDLVSHGFPLKSGFSYPLSRPLMIDDVVDIRFGDGKSLMNSPSTGHKERLERLIDGIPRDERGLELGPLDRPVLGKSQYDVYYVDHASKDDLIKKYQSTGSLATVRPDHIKQVDYVWSERLRNIVGSGYSYCLASHVIEHVADPIGWLTEVSEVLKSGARFNLAIPERSRTFDYRRQLSTVATLLESYRAKLKRPSFSQIFDHIANVAPFGGDVPDRTSSVRSAYRTACDASDRGDYVDVHCHVWTFESFRECWIDLESLDLVPFRLATLTPPLDGANEFLVSLVRH